MGIKQKFTMLAGLVGILMALVSVIGYFTASGSLKSSIETGIRATVAKETAKLDGWFVARRTSVEHAADLMTSYNGDRAKIEAPESLALASSDKEIAELTGGTEWGYFASHHAGNNTGKKDPRQRPWYQAAKANGIGFTAPYIDTYTNQLIVSAYAPFTDSSGTFIGGICNDIPLDTLKDVVSGITYDGNGTSFILDKEGEIVATSGKAEPMSKFQDVPGLGQNFSAMQQKGEGFAVVETPEGDQVLAYATIESTGWLTCIAVDYDVVYAELNHMKIVYAALTLIGLLLIVAVCLGFASRITRPIVALEDHASKLADGNLHLNDLVVESSDEIGSLTSAFNKMSGNLRKLIGNMAKTSEQVAASSEELTASAHQSADAAVRVAETVGEVSSGMDQQLRDVDTAKENVEKVFRDIKDMTAKANKVISASEDTSAAAREGAALMEAAIAKMEQIEKSVMASSDVVKTLGESSQQIGQIVEAISGIAEQTNLLSLNAAIEAARAGEQGRGFAVVAEEVRKLAAQSQESAEQIKNRIGAIQGDTEKAVQAMQDGTAEVAEGTSSIRKVGEQFQGILQKVDGINTQMCEIGNSVKAVNHGAEEIVSAVDSIDNVSRRTAENTQSISASTQEQSASNEEIAAASQSLANLATDMQTSIGQFKL